MGILAGDAYVRSIAAASIIAKVTRDRIMLQLDRDYPQYGFAQHKGYPTPAHYNALEKYGYSPVHRLSFLKKHFIKLQRSHTVRLSAGNDPLLSEREARFMKKGDRWNAETSNGNA